MFKSKFLFLVAVLFLSSSGRTVPAIADGELQGPIGQQPANKEFPLAVRLLGFVQRAESASVLLQIGSETLILRQGIPEVFTFGEALEATRLKFDAIDYDNRSILLAFPNADFGYVTCRMVDQNL